MKKLLSFLLIIFFFNIELIAMDKDLITIYLMEPLEILKDRLKEIPMLSGLIKFLMKKEKK